MSAAPQPEAADSRAVQPGDVLGRDELLIPIPAGGMAQVFFLVMDWIEGVPLNQLMKTAKAHGGVPPQIAVRIALRAPWLERSDAA